MKEQAIMHRILLAAGNGLSRLFRCNTGQAWVGHGHVHQARKIETVTLNPGDVVLRRAQPVQMGLTKGGSDTVGWTQRVIQPHDVGRVAALFTGIEVKTSTGRPTPEQLHFIDVVNDAGGIAGIARSEAEALTILSTGGKVGHISPETGNG
jgi:hypothetical protein